jgi:hypothetical protein
MHGWWDAETTIPALALTRYVGDPGCGQNSHKISISACEANAKQGCHQHAPEGACPAR